MRGVVATSSQWLETRGLQYTGQPYTENNPGPGVTGVCVCAGVFFHARA